jgi:hypothetical protein
MKLMCVCVRERACVCVWVEGGVDVQKSARALKKEDRGYL